MLLFFVKSEITKNFNRSIDLNNHTLLWLQKKPLQITQQIKNDSLLNDTLPWFSWAQQPKNYLELSSR